MPDPTTTEPPSPDYSTLTKAQLQEELAKARAALVPYLEAEQRASVLADEARARREAGQPPRQLGQIPVYDIDQPEDVLERAKAVRAGKVPASLAKLFRTDARLRAPRGSKLSERLGARNGNAIDVPLGTEVKRDELPAEDIETWVEQGALIPIA